MRHLALGSAFVLALTACSGDDGGANQSDSGSGVDSGGNVDGGGGGDATKPQGDASLVDVGADVVVADPPGIFVAVGYGGRTVRSTDDGKTWTDDASLVPNGGDDNYLLRTVVYAKNQFVALGWRSMTSPDGKTWTDHGLVKGTNWFGSVIWDGAQFVAVGGYGMKVTSTDGLAWQDHAIDTGATHSWDGLAWSGSAFATNNDNGVRARSSDGKTWTASGGSASAVKTSDVAFGNGAFVAIGGSAVLRSTDGGATFTAAATLGSAIEGLVFAQGHFTALGNGHVYTSQDGTTWTDHPVAGDQRGVIVFGHGTYVRLGAGKRTRSTDGITFTTPTADGPSNGLVMLAFGAL